ncbi:MAG: hypothetical protein ACKVOJ_01990 [Sphingomonadaceae bacterium]
MDRADTTGLGIAIVAHVALFALLTFVAVNAPPLPKPDETPVEVELVSEKDLLSAKPKAAAVPPPASAPADPEPLPQPPEPISPPPPMIEPAPPPPKPVPLSVTAPKPLPRPVPQPVPAPKPVPQPKPTPRPAPAKPAPKPVPPRPAPAKPVVKPAPRQTALVRPTIDDSRPRRRPGLSSSIISGLDTPQTVPVARPGPAIARPTAPSAPAGNDTVDAKAVQRALAAEISRQLKRTWKTPTGADVEQLVTILSWDLAPDGSLSGVPRVIDQQGDTPSNRAQAVLHRENAIKAVRAAAPFNLPSEHYKYWKSVVSFRFDKRLSQ